MTTVPPRPALIVPGESARDRGQRTGVTHESLQEQNIHGIEYTKQLGTDTRRDTKDSAYVGSAYEPWELEAVIEDLDHRIVEERNNYARIHGILEHDVNAKIGVAMGVIGRRQASQCFRFREKPTYPSVWECVQWYNNTSGLCEELRTDTSPRC